MILTGSKISEEVAEGNIVLHPFDATQINPNSYNYRLGDTLKEYVKFQSGKSIFKTIKIPESGYILKPQQMYLGNTKEIIGSNIYAMSLIGRSSIGRLGLFLQLSANLGHTGICHQWTLEIYAIKPIKVYPNMLIGQISFWTNYSDNPIYKGYYANFNQPQEAKTYCEEDIIL